MPPQDPLRQPVDEEALPPHSSCPPLDLGSLREWHDRVESVYRPPTRRDVLIVDDDAATREILADLLQTLGYSAAGVANGKEALAYLERNPPPGLILLDLQMPRMNGFALRLELEHDPTLAAVPVV